MSIAIIVSIFCGLMPHGEFLSIQRTLNFFPFFLAGFYLKQKKMITIRKRGFILVSLFIIVIVLTLIVVFAPDHFQKAKVLQRGVDHYSLGDIPLKVCLLFRSFVLALSVFIVIPNSKFLSHIGKDSMLFYLYHGLIIKLILQPLVQNYHLPSTLPWIIGYWALVIGVIFLIGKIKPLRWLTNPLPTKKNK